MAPEAWGTLRRLLTATLAELAEEPPSEAATRTAAQLLETFLTAQVERYDGLRAMRMAPALARGGWSGVREEA
jgi:hypothetical protein